MQVVVEALTRAMQEEPELAPYYELHRTLLDLQDRAREAISTTLETADEAVLQARTLQGLPMISFDDLPVDDAYLTSLAVEIAGVLAAYEVEAEAGDEPADPAGWVALARQRFEAGQVVSSESVEQQKATLAQLAADLALRPYLEWAAEQVLPQADLHRWGRSYCPACGGAPDLATLDEEGGLRRLVCSRCNSQWVYQRLGCPFCNTSDHTRLSYYASEGGKYRLYVCENCRRYLKTIDLRSGKVAPLQAERIVTVSMDAAAREAGYW